MKSSSGSYLLLTVSLILFLSKLEAGDIQELEKIASYNYKASKTI